jgi:hypothetical protein
MPTKHRTRYAISTIRGILSWRRNDFELVVQDNSNHGELEEALRGVTDPRLRYYHCTTSLDMEANFSQAALNANGEYVAFIGDDDGVTDEVMDVALWARTKGLQAVVPSGWVSFLWPDVESRAYGRRFSGALRMRRFGGRVSYPIAEQEIRKCARSGGQDFHRLPRPYFGLVHRDSMEEVRQACGTCFPGPSPDLAGAIAIATVVSRTAEIDYPIFIQGTAAQSGGGLGVTKRHVGKLEDWPHLPQWSISRWSEVVPRLFLGQTIWAEDVIQALTATHRRDLLREFNSPLLYGRCICFHPGHAREIIDTFRRQLPNAGTPQLRWHMQFLLGYLGGWWLRLGALIRNICTLASLGTETMIRDVQDSEAAMLRLSDHLRRRGVSFNDWIKKEA